MPEQLTEEQALALFSERRGIERALKAVSGYTNADAILGWAAVERDVRAALLPTPKPPTVREVLSGVPLPDREIRHWGIEDCVIPADLEEMEAAGLDCTASWLRLLAAACERERAAVAREDGDTSDTAHLLREAHDRLVTISDEADGPHPVTEDTDDVIDRIERCITEKDRRISELEARVSVLRNGLIDAADATGTAHVGEQTSDGFLADLHREIKANRKNYEKRIAALESRPEVPAGLVEAWKEWRVVNGEGDFAIRSATQSRSTLVLLRSIADVVESPEPPRESAPDGGHVTAQPQYDAEAVDELCEAVEQMVSDDCDAAIHPVCWQALKDRCARVRASKTGGSDGK